MFSVPKAEKTKRKAKPKKKAWFLNIIPHILHRSQGSDGHMSKAGETKNRILEALRERNKTLTELSNELGLSPATVSEHIRDLISSNEIREVDDVPRKWKYYQLPNDVESDRSGGYYRGRDYQAMTSKTRGIMIPIGIVLAIAVVGYLSYSLYQSFTAKPYAMALSCVATPGYNCSGSTAGTSGQLSLTVGGFNQSIQLNGIGCSYGSEPPTHFTPVSAYIPQGGQAQLNFTCQGASGLQSSSTPLHVWINYTSNGAAGVAEIATVSTQPITATTTVTVPTTTSSTTVPTTTTAPPTVNMCGAEAWISTGGSVTCESFKAVLDGLSQPNQTGVISAEISLYRYNGTLISEVMLSPKKSYSELVDGYWLNVTVNQTLFGPYSYQDKAQIELSAPIIHQPPPASSGCDTLIQVSVGENDICSPFSINLTDITQPNATGVSEADIDVYSGGALTNVTQIAQNRTAIFTVGGKILKVAVTKISSGIYAYQRSAYIYLNVTPVPKPPPPARQCNSLVTIYVSQNTSCSSFMVELTDLGQPNSNGTSPALVNVYYNNVLTNASIIYPKNTGTFTVSGNRLQVFVSNTSAGYFSYQKWARLSLNVTSVIPTPPASGCNAYNKIYIGQNDTCSPFKVELYDLSQPSGNGTSAAILHIYDNGALTNSSPVMYPGQSGTFAISGYSVKIAVNNTFAGIYAYQRWADIYINISQITPPTAPNSSCNAFVTIYIGQNDTCLPFKVELANLGQPNSNGTSPADLDIYNNGAQTNYSIMYPGQSATFVANGNSLTVIINKTFAGMYAYQKWANMYVNVTKLPPPLPSSGCNVIAAVYVGHNDTCSAFNVQLTNLGQPNSNGTSPAQLSIYYQGRLTNSTVMYPSSSPYPGVETQYFVVNYTTIWVGVNKTFTGIYSYQKWAQINATAIGRPPASGATCNSTALVYIGENDTCGKWYAQLIGFGTPNAKGISPADFNVYYNYSLISTTVIFPQSMAVFNASGNIMHLYLNQTAAGHWPYQEWVKMRIP